MMFTNSMPTDGPRISSGLPVVTSLALLDVVCIAVTKVAATIDHGEWAAQILAACLRSMASNNGAPNCLYLYACLYLNHDCSPYC